MKTSRTKASEQKARGQPLATPLGQLSLRPTALDAFVAIALAALIVRVTTAHIGVDRGGFTDEAIPFRQALTLWGWGATPATANPHFFSYPSVSIYLHWIAQAMAVLIGMLCGRFGSAADAGVEYVMDPSYLVSAARVMLSIIGGFGAIAAYLWWAPRSRVIGLGVAITLCLSPLLVRAAAQMPPEALMWPIATWLMLASTTRRKGGIATLVGVAVLAGLLVGTKLSALPCALLCLAAATRYSLTGRSRLNSFLSATALAAIVFMVSTPFAIIDGAAFARDIAYEWQHLAEGHLLGSVAGTAQTHLQQLIHAVGLPLGMALIGILVVWRSAPERMWLVMLAAASFVLPAMVAKSGGPERYLVPAVPLLWLGVSEVLFACWIDRRRSVQVLGAAIGLASVLLLGIHARESLGQGATAPAAAAGAWLRSHARADDIILAERGAVALPTHRAAESLKQSRCFAQASGRWRQAASEWNWYSVVELPFVASGKLTTMVATPNGQTITLTGFAPAWEAMPAVYALVPAMRHAYFVRAASIHTRLAKYFPELASLAVSSRDLIVSGATEATRAGVRDDPAVQVMRGSVGQDSLPALPADWWLSRADLSVPSASDVGLVPAESLYIVQAGRRQLFSTWLEPFLMQLAEAGLATRDAGASIGAARLVLGNDPENELAIRIAIVALAMSPRGAVPTSDGLSAISRAPSEAISGWMLRVLTNWGVEELIARGEIERMEQWRGAGRTAKR